MSLNSIYFLAYWCLFDKPLRLLNLLVIVIGFAFYGCRDWRFLLLIAFNSLLSYLVGLIELYRMHNKVCKWLLISSLIVNLGILEFFYNRFDWLVCLFKIIEYEMHLSRFNILLLIGISFYSLLAPSYTMDGYSRQILPMDDSIAFFAFISFVPPLAARPLVENHSLRVCNVLDKCKFFLSNEGVEYWELRNEFPDNFFYDNDYLSAVGRSV